MIRAAMMLFCSDMIITDLLLFRPSITLSVTVPPTHMLIMVYRAIWRSNKMSETTMIAALQ